MLEAEEIVREVENDVTSVLHERLSPDDVEGGGFNLADPAPFTRELAIQDQDGRVAAVAWEWKGIDTGLFDAQRFFPTREEVTVRGVTLVSEGPEGPLFNRYIDWLDVFTQVGIMVSPRPIVDVHKFWDEEDLRELHALMGEQEA
jgi:hypothetical protein